MPKYLLVEGTYLKLSYRYLNVAFQYHYVSLYSWRFDDEL